MTSLELFQALGGVSTENLAGADALQRMPAKSVSRSHLKIHRLGLLAAVLAALLLLAGCVAVYLRLQDMSIGREIYVRAFDEKGKAIEPAEKERLVINFAGIAGSPEQKASAQWYEFTESYDPDHALMTKAGDDPDIPNNYEYIYGCYTQEMVDRLNEIKNENQVELLEAEIFIQRWQDEIALEALGKTSLLREGADATMERAATIGEVSGVLFAPYNFKLEYELTLTGENPVWGKRVDVTELYQHNGYLPYNGTWHLDADTYQQWTYTTSQGVSLLLALNKTGHGFMICQLDSGILTVNIAGNTTNTDYPEPDQVPGKKAMEAFAEVIDFSVAHEPFDAAAIQSKLDIADTAYKEANTYVPEVYESYGDYILQRGYGWMPGNQYAFADLNGDGEDELLLGQDGWCGTWLTMKDGEVESLGDLGVWFRPCQNGSCEYFDSRSFSQQYRYWYSSLPGTASEEGENSSFVGIAYRDGQWWRFDTMQDAFKSKNQKSITQEEADAIRARYLAVELDWQDLRNFPLGENGSTIGSYLEALDKNPGSEAVRKFYSDYVREQAADGSCLFTHYRFLDLNGDGIEDLLLSGDGEMFWQFEVYRYGRIAYSRMMDLYLCENGVLEDCSILREGADSGNIEIEEHVFYRFHENFQLEVLDYAAYNKATAAWQSDRDGTPMDTAEAEAILAKYPRIGQEMRPVSELLG